VPSMARPTEPSATTRRARDERLPPCRMTTRTRGPKLCRVDLAAIAAEQRRAPPAAFRGYGAAEHPSSTRPSPGPWRIVAPPRRSTSADQYVTSMMRVVPDLAASPWRTRMDEPGGRHAPRVEPQATAARSRHDSTTSTDFPAPCDQPACFRGSQAWFDEWWANCQPGLGGQSAAESSGIARPLNSTALPTPDVAWHVGMPCAGRCGRRDQR